MRKGSLSVGRSVCPSQVQAVRICCHGIGTELGGTGTGAGQLLAGGGIKN